MVVLHHLIDTLEGFQSNVKKISTSTRLKYVLAQLPQQLLCMYYVACLNHHVE